MPYEFFSSNIWKPTTLVYDIDRINLDNTQSRINGAVRGAHSQLWGTIIPVYSLYAARKYDRRLGTPAIV